MNLIITLLLAGSLFLGYQWAWPQNILIWKNVGQSSFINPETGVLVTADLGIKLALSSVGLAFDAVERLPEDLSSYELLFITLGFPVDCG